MRVTRASASASAQAVTVARAHLDRAGVIEDAWAQRWLTPGRRLLVGLLGRWPLRGYGRSPSFAFLAARTVFFDRAVTCALDEGVGQVVIVGAGYDSRAVRLARTSVRFFELDHPATQVDKQRRARAAGVVFVPVDLGVDEVDEALVSAGFATGAPAVFIVEGLTMYLTETATEAMFGRLAGLAAPGSRLAVNFSAAGGGSVSPASRAVAWAVRFRWRLWGEPTHYWATTRNVPPMLARAGWAPDELITGPDLAARHIPHTTMRTAGINTGMFCVTAHSAPTHGGIGGASPQAC
jgi:methyltransferase (TIGR00027 family)